MSTYFYPAIKFSFSPTIQDIIIMRDKSIEGWYLKRLEFSRKFIPFVVRTFPWYIKKTNWNVFNLLKKHSFLLFISMCESVF